MESTQVVIKENSFGEVLLFSNGIEAGKINVGMVDGNLAAFHTEVYPEFEGHGLAKLLLDELVRYAKEKGLKIVPLCPYVNAQFNRHPGVYEDVWLKF